ncbi:MULTISPECIES: hypothetical protein [Streptomyces]|uniref:Lipoprotein n=1 Tax=Streptomyces auratus AGR0001 TaxID=1160718 RepID=J1REL6_9ACTN|nr:MULTISPECIES: hypothetical protein [Streptomyces]MCF3176237.1 hypothetical protein [Streptomyces sioyaensis]PJJ06281.1 hypothetical protein BX264_6786 [Streptomyces sp. 2333.5]QTZ95519.1 hypothetical protein SU9_032050 [Streptomyces auratus AGR0001]TXD00173.1 hypothetical protein FS847_02870 [Streptomyces sp. ISID311]SEE93261.1 hypothetical protein SAMN05428943_6889 [Streptomyces sp. 2314.4]
MRIRAAIAASALATTIVMGGASAALACNNHHHYKHHRGHGHHAACWLSAGVLERVGPVFSEGCERSGWGFDGGDGYRR